MAAGTDKIYFSMDKYIALQKKDRARDKRVTAQPDESKLIFKDSKPKG